MRATLGIFFLLTAGFYRLDLGARLAHNRLLNQLSDPAEGSSESVGAFPEYEPAETDPLRIYIPQPQISMKSIGKRMRSCGSEIADHQLSNYDETNYRSVMCNEKRNPLLWDNMRALDFYFGINEGSTSKSKRQLRQMVEEATITGGNNPDLSDLANCCKDEAEDCCSSCKEMVSFDTLEDAIKMIEVARENLCSEESILKAEGAWDEVVQEARRVKWDSPTEKGEFCIDAAECDTNKHHNGKSWCYTNGTRKDLEIFKLTIKTELEFFDRRPWDYCLPSVRYMCAISNIDCTAMVTESQCSLGYDVDSCTAQAGCAYKAGLCVPAEFELLDSSKPLKPQVGLGLRPRRKEWAEYYRKQFDILLVQVAAEQRNYSDVIEFCSRLPFEHCMAPCTRHGLGSSIIFARITPWQSSFGYCSLQGHYKAKTRKAWESTNMNKIMEAMRIGTAEFGLKIFNGVPLMLSYLAWQHFHPGDLLPKAFQEGFFAVFCNTVIKGHNLIDHALDKLFSTFGQPVPGLFRSNAFYMIVKAPVVEEVVYRGLVSGAFRFVSDHSVRGVMNLIERLGLFTGKLNKRDVLERTIFIVTQLTTSFCFAYMHTWSAELPVSSVTQAIFSFWSGLTFQVVHQKFGITYSTLAHNMNNALATAWNELKPDIARLLADDPDIANKEARQELYERL